ncbi:MAG: hypothetical protein QOI83_993 [Streptomycetaceae bacterium]|nr:hypothetical protein [Streptomycetaceae bacterium]
MSSDRPRVPCWLPRVEHAAGPDVPRVKPAIYGQPANGITDSEHYVFRADAATEAPRYIGAGIGILIPVRRPTGPGLIDCHSL